MSSTILASDTSTQTWTTVPAPTQALNFCGAGYNLVWSYPFDTPSPAGTYEISNAIMDRSHRVGAWSAPATLVLQSGWILYGGTWNQPVTSDDIGIVWKVKKIAGTNVRDYTNGSEHFYMTAQEMQSVCPYSINAPYPTEIKERWERYGTIAGLTTGGRNTTVAPAPVVYASQLPREAMDFAYARLTETGETALSPIYHLVPDAMNGSATMRAQFTITEQHPQGTLGYFVYVRPASTGVWQRVPAPHCYGQPANGDDWLWEWSNKQPLITRLATSTFAPSPASPAQSRLTDLHLALKNTYGNIVVPSGANYDTYCPLIDEWRNGGAFPNWTFYRTIAPTDNGKWYINPKTTQNGCSYWPAVGIYNLYSTWMHLGINPNGNSAAMAFADVSGGNSFGTRVINCGLNGGTSAAGVTCGVKVDARCAGSSLNLGGHTASELAFDDCTFTGDVPIWLGGQQTANVRIGHTHVSANSYDRRSSSVYLECGNQIRFVDGLFIEGAQAGAIFRANVWNANVGIDDIWIDQGYRCLFEAGNVAFNVLIHGGKINTYANVPGTGERITFARFIDSPAVVSVINLYNIDLQFNDVAALDVLHTTFNCVSLRFTDTTLADIITLREPTRDQANAAAVILFNGNLGSTPYPERDVPGLKASVYGTVVEIPVFTNTVSVRVNGARYLTNIPISVPARTVPAPAQVIVCNSFTNRATVQRLDWKS